jgi:hypothetical protein
MAGVQVEQQQQAEAGVEDFLGGLHVHDQLLHGGAAQVVDGMLNLLSIRPVGWCAVSVGLILMTAFGFGA